MQILCSKIYFLQNKQILNYILEQVRITHAVINTLSTCKQVIMSVDGVWLVSRWKIPVENTNTFILGYKKTYT